MEKKFSTETAEERREIAKNYKQFLHYEYKNKNPMLPQYTEFPEDRITFKQEYIKDKDGNKFCVQRWGLTDFEKVKSPLDADMGESSNDSEKPILLKGVVFFVHGYAGTIQFNSALLIKNLCMSGFRVVAMDGYGHGLSDGLHCYIPDFHKYVSQYKEIYDSIASEYPGLKKFLLSVSMGGAVSFLLLKADTANIYSGAVLLSPMLKLGDDIVPNRLVLLTLKAVAYIFPTAKKTPAPDKPPRYFNDDQLNEYMMKNPLLYYDPGRLWTSIEILKVCNYIGQRLHEFSTPFLVLHGADDMVTSPQASKLLLESASSTDKTYKEYAGQAHALLFEEKGEEVFKDIVDWLSKRI